MLMSPAPEVAGNLQGQNPEPEFREFTKQDQNPESESREFSKSGNSEQHFENEAGIM